MEEFWIENLKEDLILFLMKIKLNEKICFYY